MQQRPLSTHPRIYHLHDHWLLRQYVGSRKKFRAKAMILQESYYLMVCRGKKLTLRRKTLAEYAQSRRDG